MSNTRETRQEQLSSTDVGTLAPRRLPSVDPNPTALDVDDRLQGLESHSDDSEYDERASVEGEVGYACCPRGLY